MTATQKTLSIYTATGLLLLCVDQFLKYIARTNPNAVHHLGTRWLGWEYFANPGIAFSLPFPNILLIIVTPLVVLGLIIFLTKQTQHGRLSLGVLLIIFGAISNFVDRMLFEITIDYLRIFTSIINIADIMIVVGAVLMLFGDKKSKTG